MNKRTAKVILLLVACIFIISGCGKKEKADKLSDGNYKATVTLEGGSGKAGVESPSNIEVKDGKIYATIVWSSKNYDYMIVDGVKYLNEAKEGEASTFTFPIDDLPCDMDVIGDTVAMGNPHEIEYVLHFKLEE